MTDQSWSVPYNRTQLSGFILSRSKSMRCCRAEDKGHLRSISLHSPIAVAYEVRLRPRDPSNLSSGTVLTQGGRDGILIGAYDSNGKEMAALANSRRINNKLESLERKRGSIAINPSHHRHPSSASPSVHKDSLVLVFAPAPDASSSFAGAFSFRLCALTQGSQIWCIRKPDFKHL